jgi:hypothetical protein
MSRAPLSRAGAREIDSASVAADGGKSRPARVTRDVLATSTFQTRNFVRGRKPFGAALDLVDTRWCGVHVGD